MKKFDLNIDKILPDWEIKHAIREIIANALDEQKLTNSQEISISKESFGIWHIKDYGRGIRIEHFTQNENQEKLNSQKVIGKFGIGLKDALATFERHGIEIKILSKFGDYTLGKSSKQDFEDLITLHVYLDPPSNPYMVGTDVIMKSINDRDIEEAKRFFLKFSDVEKLEETKYGEILTKATNAGNIYINDVLVAQEENFLFSYNITIITAAIRKALNRERSNVGRTAYAPNIRQILLNCNSEDVQQELIDDLKRYYAGTSHDELKWVDVQEYAVKLLNSREKVVFVTTDDMVNKTNLIDEINITGSNIIAIPTNLQEKISGQTDFSGEKIRDIHQFATERSENFEYKFVSYDNLSYSERQVYDKMQRLLNLIGGKPFNVRAIRISETMQKDLYTFLPAAGLWTGSEIIIKRSELVSTRSFLGTFLHELAHATSGASDVSRSFEQQLTKYLGQLANLIVE